MFLTSMAGNALIASLALSAFGVEISWGLWIAGSIVPALCSLIIIPFVLYLIYPPEIKDFPEGKKMGRRELEKMGAMSKDQKVMVGIFLGSLTLWATGGLTGINATTVGMMALCALVISGILSWGDILGEKGAWNTLVWMGGLISLAGGLNTLGFIGWFAKLVSSSMGDMNWILVTAILLLIYVYAHYFFASLTAHITAMYAAFGAVAIAAGAPAMLIALVFAYASNLMMPITHYGGAPAPIIFSAGYVTQGEWWKLGFIITVINLLIWSIIGSIWWKVLGLW